MSARRMVAAVVIVLLTSPVFTVNAEETNYRVVDNVRIYLGVIPAAMVRGKHPATHTETSMHGGIPSDADEYHILIALFDERNGERILNATVTARVAEVGLNGEKKTLEPMQIAGTTTYGNYFTMKGTGVSRINVVIRVPDAPRDIDVTFQHRHQ